MIVLASRLAASPSRASSPAEPPRFLTISWKPSRFIRGTLRSPRCPRGPSDPLLREGSTRDVVAGSARRPPVATTRGIQTPGGTCLLTTSVGRFLSMRGLVHTQHSPASSRRSGLASVRRPKGLPTCPRASGEARGHVPRSPRWSPKELIGPGNDERNRPTALASGYANRIESPVTGCLSPGLAPDRNRLTL